MGQPADALAGLSGSVTSTGLTGRAAFLFGVNSIVGWSMARALAEHTLAHYFCNQHTRIPAGMSWRRLNLQDREQVAAVLTRERPSLIIHCAGICNVEKCETSPAFAHEVNVRGMEVLLDHAPDDARVVYLSSDHVFSGDGGPYYESSVPDPVSVYGRTRVLAEAMLRARRPDALIVRGGLWIGPSCSGRLGHLDWLRHRTRRGLPTTVVRDEHRSAVWAEVAARRVLAMTAAGLTGVRHVVARRIVARPVLAGYLNRRFAIGARIGIMTRADRPVPHPGRVDLRTEYGDAWAEPLESVVPDGVPDGAPDGMSNEAGGC